MRRPAHRAAPAPARAYFPCAVSKFGKRTWLDPHFSLRARCRRPVATGAAARATAAAPLLLRRVAAAPSAAAFELPPHGTLKVGCFPPYRRGFQGPAADGARFSGAWAMVKFFEPLRTSPINFRVQILGRARGARGRNRQFLQLFFKVVLWIPKIQLSPACLYDENVLHTWALHVDQTAQPQSKTDRDWSLQSLLQTL